MILEFLKDTLDGKSWEQLCDGCYRDRFQDVHYTKVPPNYQGDAGIEGFTRSGIVYQCYCPEKEYTDNELYEAQRDKVTKDIGKLIDKSNAKRLTALGINCIKEWHFVIPEYRDKRIVEHLEKKRVDVIEKKKKDPETFFYIDDNIILVIKEAEDFKAEIVRLIRNPLVDTKLNIAVKSVSQVDWTKCDTEKINNIKRKVMAIMNTNEEDEDYKEMVQFWAEAYLKGLEIMSTLQQSYGSIYEDLFELEQQYKADVSMKSKMNSDHSLNNTLFNEIMTDFETTLTEEFSTFSKASIMELKRDLISSWLADCSLQFKVGK
ncbi:hypothetical protein HCJ52_12435 [Listeria sp. FSL L7-1485]|uniref:Uncharacterized protein n=1 Tax=Listeria immobilis TaxID=2713502 RepID=A0A7X0X991_9LIST|nr:hypothetical protein [Listeria immobilis]MBC1489938.1 hypothetical protein [Listeria immobilis]MBC1536932.1 hypothetical protein [Listeria immobilis]